MIKLYTVKLGSSYVTGWDMLKKCPKLSYDYHKASRFTNIEFAKEVRNKIKDSKLLIRVETEEVVTGVEGD